MKKIIMTVTVMALTLPLLASASSKYLSCASAENPDNQVKVMDIRNADQSSGTYDADLSIQTPTMVKAAVFNEACKFIVGSKPVNYKVIKTGYKAKSLVTGASEYRSYISCGTGKLSLFVDMKGQKMEDGSVAFNGQLLVNRDVDSLSALKFDQLRKKIVEGLNASTSYKVDYSLIQSGEVTCSFK